MPAAPRRRGELPFLSFVPAARGPLTPPALRRGGRSGGAVSTPLCRGGSTAPAGCPGMTGLAGRNAWGDVQLAGAPPPPSPRPVRLPRCLTIGQTPATYDRLWCAGAWRRSRVAAPSTQRPHPRGWPSQGGAPSPPPPLPALFSPTAAMTGGCSTLVVLHPPLCHDPPFPSLVTSRKSRQGGVGE